MRTRSASCVFGCRSCRQNRPRTSSRRHDRRLHCRHHQTRSQICLPDWRIDQGTYIVITNDRASNSITTRINLQFVEITQQSCVKYDYRPLQRAPIVDLSKNPPPRFRPNLRPAVDPGDSGILDARTPGSTAQRWSVWQIDIIYRFLSIDVFDTSHSPGVS